MYENTDEVLNTIKHHLEEKFGEAFEFSRSRCDSFASYKSNSYFFDVMAAFIQARVQADFSTPIDKRIDEVLAKENIKKGTYYKLTSKIVSAPIPIEYCIEVL
ncbi:hypothetical protein [Azotobacter beijerinckii]|uniref:Uncharacterized protein n=1 Tax=Azotobacter beijerinckii TaxID=170623 RepID=A0A1I3YDM9_9GAMM|nr:hypothetical protein [Azotobacter beijerinckii]SFK29880.1 hypothetical protein SAMN04244574_00077 [Azotobacter beijerinckii]